MTGTDFDFDELEDLAAGPQQPLKPFVDPSVGAEVDLESLLAGVSDAPSKPAGKPKHDPGAQTGPDPSDFLVEAGLRQQQRQENAGELFKPWMRYHRFNLVKSVAEVRAIVDAAIKHGRCALDLETHGFDNRTDYLPATATTPQHLIITTPHASYFVTTRHKIVGFCLSVKGVGHYIPVRHNYDKVFGDRNPNVDLAGVEAEIRRLCLAAQPTFDRTKDPFAGPVTKPGQLVIYFWNAKFDQEFLWPVTGLDVWHPDSFEDGMLSAYTYYSDDDNLGLKNKSLESLFITDPEDKGPDGVPIVHPYEMIKFEDLFPKGMKNSERRFADLYPEDGSPEVLYGCSDAICTEILCESKRVAWEYTKTGLIAKYADVLSPVLKKSYLKSTYRLEKQTTAAVREIERVRTQIDLEETKVLLEEAKLELKDYENRICKLAASKGFKDFNPGSGQQLSDFLFGPQGLNITPRPELTSPGSGQFKTDAKTLEALFEVNPEVEVLEWIVKYRQVDKVIGTYLAGFTTNCDEFGQLRFNFKQHGAATGRFTAPAGDPAHGFSGVPVQGIPARDDPHKPKAAQALRRLFIGRPGYTVVKVDYAGQELRVVANISGEPKWVDEFKSARAEGREADLHTLTAVAFYPGLQKSDPDFKIKRTAGKIANFSLIYGGGVQAIMRATGCDKVEAARKLAAFHQSVPIFAGWMKKQHETVKTQLGVFTGFRRFIRIPDANIKLGDVVNGKPITDEQDIRRIRAACERKSTNYPIQGSGADILKISLVKLHKELAKRGWLKSQGGDDSVRMIMTVHDEVDFEIRHERLMEAMPVIIACMEFPSQLVPSWPIPLVVEPDIGLSWEAKYSWVKIMNGEAPVPSWLVGHVTPGAGPVGSPLSAPTPLEERPQPPPTTEPTEVEDAPPTSKSRVDPLAQTEPVRRSGREVVTFVIPKAHVTLQLVPVLMAAIAGSVRVPEAEKGTLLRILTSEEELLLDPNELGIRIDPDRLAMRLQDCNLGTGEYEITVEDR